MFHINSINETFFTPENRKRHYNQHVATSMEQYLYDDDVDELFDPEMTERDYDMEADELSKQPIRTSDVDSSDRYVR